MADIKVSTDAIDKEARLWEEQAATAKGVSDAALQLGLHFLYTGTIDLISVPALFLLSSAFMMIVDNNNQVCGLVYRSCIKANQTMGDAALALRRNAQAYRDREVEITESVDGAY